MMSGSVSVLFAAFALNYTGSPRRVFVALAFCSLFLFALSVVRKNLALQNEIRELAGTPAKKAAQGFILTISELKTRLEVVGVDGSLAFAKESIPTLIAAVTKARVDLPKEKGDGLRAVLDRYKVEFGNERLDSLANLLEFFARRPDGKRLIDVIGDFLNEFEQAVRH